MVRSHANRFPIPSTLIGLNWSRTYNLFNHKPANVFNQPLLEGPYISSGCNCDGGGINSIPSSPCAATTTFIQIPQGFFLLLFSFSSTPLRLAIGREISSIAFQPIISKYDLLASTFPHKLADFLFFLRRLL